MISVELGNMFEQCFLDKVTCRQWTNVDRTNLQLIKFPVDAYIEKITCSFILGDYTEWIYGKNKKLTE